METLKKSFRFLACRKTLFFEQKQRSYSNSIVFGKREDKSCFAIETTDIIKIQKI
ncbi:MAG: hypothetical protein NTX24_05175 [Candidatus Pacearchaeota archaeon]|nr:hypothetical protein [Candidatus Pacearchaeota archaeon]